MLGSEIAAQRKRLIVRWSVLSSVAIALFWTVYWMVTSEVPVVTAIRVTSSWTWVLPFSVSHWWDILNGPFWTIILTMLLTGDIEEHGDGESAGVFYMWATFALLINASLGLLSMLVHEIPLVGSLVCSAIMAIMGLMFSNPIDDQRLSTNQNVRVALTATAGLLIGLSFTTVPLVFTVSILGPIVGFGMVLAFLIRAWRRHRWQSGISHFLSGRA